MAERAGDTVAWPLRHNYYCGACGWIGPQADFPVEPEKCPRCAANPDGSDPSWPDGTYKRPAQGWACYHCGETFHSNYHARQHFGADPLADPACQIKAGEHGLVRTIRSLEEQLARYRDEDSDKDREFHRISAEHAVALRREEEKGYERGLRDERERALRIAARIKEGLRNGGARNACDAIASDIRDYADG